VIQHNPSQTLEHNKRAVFIVSVLLVFFMLWMVQPVIWAQSNPVNWTTLNLSQDQNTRIYKLEQEWHQVYNQVHPKIVRDKQKMKMLLMAPGSDKHQVMQLQDQIQKNEQQLRREATRIFMDKKGSLSPAQCVKLEKMMGR